ncbi:hypothetical protein HDV00_002233 [Rhizophlyctis rosea]|nr:hypothetical protein HDV00_002233 [Rhizophlyctis rosea]
MIFQTPNPAYSTTKTISDPTSWSEPKVMIDSLDPLVDSEKGVNPWETWIDYFNICDKTHCHLFYSNDNGDWFRHETPKDKFPLGWSKAYQMWNATFKGDWYEGGAIYKIKGEQTYLAIVEAGNDNFVR